MRGFTASLAILAFAACAPGTRVTLLDPTPSPRTPSAELVLYPDVPERSDSVIAVWHPNDSSGPVTSLGFTKRVVPSRALREAPLLSSRTWPSPQDSVNHRQPHVSRPIVGGFVGAVVGAGAGGVLGGLWAGQQTAHDDPALLTGLVVLGGIVGGAALGEPWGAACGVHIGNRRRGNPLPALLASVAVAAGGVGAAFAADDWRVLLAIPVVQVAVAVPIERSTARGTPRQSRLCSW